MIRFIAGLLLTFGAVGGIENDPEAPLLILMVIAAVGLTLMYFGGRAVGRKYE